ncbi:MAG TPA: hypothetical protein VED83_02385 [Burkholderiaceae bacterium]|nr:hypothetical protein [Burkholderiaceae bacterium]
MNRLPLALALLASSASALASGLSLDTIQNLNQSQFYELAQDLGASLSYKPLEAADPLGIAGFDLGLAVTGTSLANRSALQVASNGSSVYSVMPEPSLRVIKGLPYNVDAGVMFAKVPDSSINLFGGELKWAVLPGGLALPSVALRAAITRMNGVGQLDFESVSADVSVSEGFVWATPYIGTGEVWSRTSTDGLPLSQENLSQYKIFGGVSLKFGPANLVVEADSTGGIHSYGIKAGFRF